MRRAYQTESFEAVIRKEDRDRHFERVDRIRFNSSVAKNIKIVKEEEVSFLVSVTSLFGVKHWKAIQGRHT